MILKGPAEAGFFIAGSRCCFGSNNTARHIEWLFGPSVGPNLKQTKDFLPRRCAADLKVLLFAKLLYFNKVIKFFYGVRALRPRVPTVGFIPSTGNRAGGLGIKS